MACNLGLGQVFESLDLHALALLQFTQLYESMKYLVILTLTVVHIRVRIFYPPLLLRLTSRGRGAFVYCCIFLPTFIFQRVNIEFTPLSQTYIDLRFDFRPYVSFAGFAFYIAIYVVVSQQT